jgi:hypothetical protein
MSVNRPTWTRLVRLAEGCGVILGFSELPLVRRADCSPEGGGGGHWKGMEADHWHWHSRGAGASGRPCAVQRGWPADSRDVLSWYLPIQGRLPKIPRTQQAAAHPSEPPRRVREYLDRLRRYLTVAARTSWQRPGPLQCSPVPGRAPIPFSHLAARRAAVPSPRHPSSTSTVLHAGPRRPSFLHLFNPIAPRTEREHRPPPSDRFLLPWRIAFTATLRTSPAAIAIRSWLEGVRVTSHRPPFPPQTVQTTAPPQKSPLSTWWCREAGRLSLVVCTAQPQLCPSRLVINRPTTTANITPDTTGACVTVCVLAARRRLLVSPPFRSRP